MTKPKIQIDDLGNSRDMTEEEIQQYGNVKQHDLPTLEGTDETPTAD
jgi:hypothetical protein